MHPVSTMKHWSNLLHDSLLVAWQEIDQHLHSRHFWVGVAVTLLVLGFLTLAIMLAMNAPVSPTVSPTYGFPYGSF